MGISVTKLLIELGIAIVLFGTKRLRNAGSDIGAAIKISALRLRMAKVTGRKKNRIRRSKAK